MALAPGALVYFVSVQFLARSIESWFDVKVDAALEGAINSSGNRRSTRCWTICRQRAARSRHELADRTVAQQVVLLNRLREQAGVQEAVLVTASGRVLASASADVIAARAGAASPADAARGTRRARLLGGRRAGRQAAGVARHRAARAGSRWRSGATCSSQQIGSGAIRQRASEAVEAAYRDYRELALSRQGLKRIYIVTLTLALFDGAVRRDCARRDARAAACRAARQSGAGDPGGGARRLQPADAGDQPRRARRAHRVVQLDDAPARRSAPRRSRPTALALETAKARLENILANLTAGVLVFDPQLALSIANRGARGILGGELDACAGVPLEQWPESLQSFARACAAARVARRPWQIEFELKGTGKTLLARGAALSSDRRHRGRLRRHYSA